VTFLDYIVMGALVGGLITVFVFGLLFIFALLLDCDLIKINRYGRYK
jgi:hypothetical protein